MRHRHVRHLEEKLAEVADFLVEDPRAWRGRWREIFGQLPAGGARTCAATDIDPPSRADMETGAGSDPRFSRAAQTSAVGPGTQIEQALQTSGAGQFPAGGAETDAVGPAPCQKAAAMDPASAPLFLEIGCGKGQFILTQARLHPDCLYLAVEGQGSVILRALQKAAAAAQPNLRLFIDFVQDVRDYFAPGELSGIYLNFSDPWPKARHVKRRLTYRGRLESYFAVLAPDGFVEVKTDDPALYRFTLEEIRAAGLCAASVSEDLYASGLAAGAVTTEYEDKFRAEGRAIRYVRIERNP